MKDDLLRRYLREQNEDYERKLRGEERFGTALGTLILFCACVLLIYVLFYQ